MNARRLSLVLVAYLIAGMPGAVSAQTVSVPSALEQAVAELRLEVQRLREEVERLKAAGTAPLPAVEMVQAQVAEQAQTKVESQSRLPVKIFGTIHSGTFVNRGNANWLENPNLVVPGAGDGRSFSSTLKQSRIGLMVDGGTLGDWRTSGVLAFDFFGGVPGFQTGPVMGLPRLLYGFARFESGDTAIEVGQDQMILAPRDPFSLGSPTFPALYRAGNLYLRVPQIRVEHKLRTGAVSTINLMGGIVAPIAGDFAADYLFAPPALSGERSGYPGAQARIGWTLGGDTASRRAEFGLGGHVGRHRVDGLSRTSWATAIDADIHVGRAGFGGEFYTGDRLAAFGGAIGQQARAHGGYVEGRFALSRRLNAGVGLGRDRVAASQTRPMALTGNEARFGNLTYYFTPEIAGAFEYRWLVTTPLLGDRLRNDHLNWTLAYSF
jgi:hypothetical protein